MSPHQLTNAERTRCTTQHANDKPAIHLPPTSTNETSNQPTRVDPHQQQIDDRKHYTIEPADPTLKIIGTTQIISLQVIALTPGAVSDAWSNRDDGTSKSPIDKMILAQLLITEAAVATTETLLLILSITHL